MGFPPRSSTGPLVQIGGCQPSFVRGVHPDHQRPEEERLHLGGAQRLDRRPLGGVRPRIRTNSSLSGRGDDQSHEGEKLFSY